MKYLTTVAFGLLAASLLIGGCGPTGKKNRGGAKAGQKHENHDHGKGPNGGVVFDLGSFHAEFTVDHDKKECTVVVLGDDEKTPTPVAAKDLTLSTKETKTKEGKTVPSLTIKLLPKDAAAGKAAKFVGTDPGLGNVADFEGTILGEIDGKPAQGSFKEE